MECWDDEPKDFQGRNTSVWAADANQVPEGSCAGKQCEAESLCWGALCPCLLGGAQLLLALQSSAPHSQAPIHWVMSHPSRSLPPSLPSRLPASSLPGPNTPTSPFLHTHLAKASGSGLPRGTRREALILVFAIPVKSGDTRSSP